MAVPETLTPRFDVLIEDDGAHGEDPLLAAYGGALSLRGQSRRIVANFVSSVDGVVAFSDEPKQGTGAVSLNSWPDRFVMGLLRASADCIVIGAGTLRRDSRHQWTAPGIARERAAEMTELRHRLCASDTPAALVVVTATGNLPSEHPALTNPAAPVLIISTAQGRRRLDTVAPGLRCVAVSDSDVIAADAIVTTVESELGARTILCEGGPTLLGRLVESGCVDELFLTVAPHLAGRSADAQRPGLIESVAFPAGATTRLRLRSLRRFEDHLFLRYAVISNRTPSEAG